MRIMGPRLAFKNTSELIRIVKLLRDGGFSYKQIRAMVRESWNGK